MTSSIRSRLPGSSSSSGRRSVDPEERFARRVTLLFIGLIVAVVAIVVFAFIYDYYVGHLKPVASVGGTSISRDQWSNRAKLEFQRLQVQEQTTREQISAGTLSVEEGNVRLQNIASARNNVASSSIENLIDLAFKGQLATQAGLTVTDADVDDAIKAEGTTPEARQISVIFVEPESLAPTPEERQAAFTAAQEAAAALEAGTPFPEVAATYSTDPSSETGGDFGFVTADSTLDPAFIGTIFALGEGETTPVIQGADGVWRIGRVDGIRPGTMGSRLEQVMRDEVGWDLYRSEVRKEALAQKLEDQVVTDATAGDVEQADLAEIVLEGDTSVPPDEDEGTVRAAHILYSPNDDPTGAQTLDPEDPAWAEAQAEAETAVAQLSRVTAPDRRQFVFGARAKAQSDDTGSGANGGDLDFAKPDAYVPEFGSAMKALAKGQMTDAPVKSNFGWHIIRLEDVREASFPAFAEVKDQIKQRVEQQRMQAFQEELRAKARTDYKFGGQ